MQETIYDVPVRRLERHPDACAAGGSFRYRDRSIMPPDNLLNEIETQTRAAAVALRPVNRFKYALAIASLYARTVIGHPHPWRAAQPAPAMPPLRPPCSIAF